METMMTRLVLDEDEVPRVANALDRGFGDGGFRVKIERPAARGAQQLARAGTAADARNFRSVRLNIRCSFRGTAGIASSCACIGSTIDTDGDAARTRSLRRVRRRRKSNCGHGVTSW